MNPEMQKTRRLKKRINKTKRSLSSRQWLERQINDPFVIEASQGKYRSRSSFKLLELDKKFNLFKKGNSVLDLGSYPGGWSQVVVDSVFPNTSGGRIIAVDIKEMEPIDGVNFINGNIMEEEIIKLIKKNINYVDVVISDMAASSIGHKSTDQIRSQDLAECALGVANIFLKNKGKFCCKVILGGETPSFVNKLKEKFEYVKRYKPVSSRKKSAEIFLVGLNYRQDLVE